MVENVGVAVEISLLSHSVPELSLLPVYRPPLLFPVVSWMSADIGQCCRLLQRFGRGKKCMVSVEISLRSHAVSELLLLPVIWPPLLFLVAGRHLQCRDQFQ